MYRHTQVGYLVLVVVGGSAILCSLLVLIPGPPKAVVLAAAVGLALATVLFASLTVSVGEGKLLISFGPGVIRKRWSLADVAACEVVTNRWWSGWGVHLTPKGWLYNVSGSGGVEVTLRDGSGIVIGSDQPEQLCRALRTAIGQSPAGAVRG